jgi:hypothetical protein
MLLFELLAEQKIAEAVSRGEFDHLPGAGKPLDLDEDALVPEDLRMACRILKNAGYSLGEVTEGDSTDRVQVILRRVEQLRIAAECRPTRRRCQPG